MSGDGGDGGLVRDAAAQLDPVARLAGHTHARVGLGRHGTGIPSGAYLQFQADHALARDAVYETFNSDAIHAACDALGLPMVVVESKAESTSDYLRHPEHGRAMSEASAEGLRDLARAHADSGHAVYDVVFVVSAGLSALGVNLHGSKILELTVPRLRAAGLAVGPVVVCGRARVGIINDIGGALGCASIVMLIGERPGLSAPDSVGAYFEFAPRPGLTDANRNCISNIRPQGLPLEEAAEQLDELISTGLARKVSGTELKIDSQAPEALGQ